MGNPSRVRVTGPLEPYAAGFASELARVGYTQHSTSHQLRVFAPDRFIHRLQQARSDALKGDAWLLAGEGRIRAAAQLEIVEAR